MDFPEQSIKQAREVVEKYRRRFPSKLGLASQLYSGYFLHVDYGFSEAIRDGNCGKYLHEIKKETDCFTMAGVLYLIAREAGLKPEIYLASKIKDFDEGEDQDSSAGADHTFITAVTGKDNVFIIDKHMSLFGKATFNFDKNIIQVYDKLDSKVTFRKYASIRKLSEQEYLAKLEEDRSPRGGKLALSTTQAVTSLGKRVYLTYLPKTQELKSSLHSKVANFGPEPYRRYLIIDMITPVEKNGDFDFNKGSLLFYYASAPGWTEHDNPQIPLIFPVESAQNFWKIIDSLALKLGRKSSVNKMRADKLSDMIIQSGFKDNFEIEKNSVAEQVTKGSLEDILKQVISAQEKSVNDFSAKFKDDELTYKTFLIHVQYIKARDKAISKENPYGFIFSNKQHLQLLKDAFRDYVRENALVFRRSIEDAKVYSGLSQGKDHIVKRKAHKDFEMSRSKMKYLSDMSAFRKSSFPLSFNISADRYLFERTLDLASLSNMETGLNEDDIKRAAQWKLFEWLASTRVLKDALFLAAFKKGLKKILSQEN